jgi:nucleotide-binding universal stress UspA family protein
MRILLAVDDSKGSEIATRAVLRQTRPQGTEVRVLSVTDVVAHRPFKDKTGYYGKIRAMFQGETERLEALVARTAALLRAKGFKVTSSVQGGDPRDKILDVATKRRADLIVLGSHGRSGLHHLLMGSVSETIVRHAHCSVAVIRGASANSPRGSPSKNAPPRKPQKQTQ